MAIYRHPPQPFVGGSQPLAPKKLVPQDAVVVVNDPPFGSRSWIESVIESWQSKAPWLEPRRFVQPEVVVDNPPFGLRTWLSAIRGSWEQPLGLPRRSAYVIQDGVVVADNPPFGLASIWRVLRSWEPELGLPNRITYTVQAGAAAVAGYDYTLRVKRRRIILDGKRYFLTPQEEADLLNSLIARLEREKDRLEAPALKQEAKRSRPPKRIREEVKRIDEKIDRFKIHLALLKDRELDLDQSIRSRLRAIQELEEEEALTFILALA